MHILLVDDHALYRAGLKKLITSLIPNVSITEVGNGEEAMSIIQDTAFDVLILDLAIPIMNGFELIADLKKRRLKNFKILAVTNYTENGGCISSAATRG